MKDRLKQLDYKNSVAFIARNASKTLEKALDSELLRTHKLSSARWKVITALAAHNGLNQKELAGFLSLDASSLVPIIDNLEQNRFVTRKPDTKDRRNNRIIITKKAESVIDQIVDAILELRRSVYKNISVEDIETAKMVLKKMTENAESVIKSGHTERVSRKKNK